MPKGRGSVRALLTSASAPAGILGVSKANERIPGGINTEVGLNVPIEHFDDVSLIPYYLKAAGIAHLHANFAENDPHTDIERSTSIIRAIGSAGVEATFNHDPRMSLPFMRDAHVMTGVFGYRHPELFFPGFGNHQTAYTQQS